MVSTLCPTPSRLGAKKFPVQTLKCLSIGIELESRSNTNRKHLRLNYVFQFQGPPPAHKYCLVTAKVNL